MNDLLKHLIYQPKLFESMQGDLLIRQVRLFHVVLVHWATCEDAKRKNKNETFEMIDRSLTYIRHDLFANWVIRVKNETFQRRKKSCHMLFHFWKNCTAIIKTLERERRIHHNKFLFRWRFFYSGPLRFQFNDSFDIFQCFFWFFQCHECFCSSIICTMIII